MNRSFEAESDPDLAAVWGWFEFQSQLIASELQRFSLVFEGQMSSEQLDRSLKDRLFGLDRSEVEQIFAIQRFELERLTMLALFTTAEAILRIDYERRATMKQKDSLSRKYREIWRKRRGKARLEDDLLEVLKGELSPPSIVTDFRAAQKLRHWLAHGRWWNPKLGRDYLPADIFDISKAITDALR